MTTEPRTDQPANEQYAVPPPAHAYGPPGPQYPQGYGPAPYQQAPPPQPPYGGFNGAGYYAPAGGASPAPVVEAPGIGMVIAITALFGLFGIIPASSRAKKARKLGLSSGKYWKAFGITFAVVAALFIVASMGGGSAETAAPAATARTVEPAANIATVKPAVTTPAAAQPTPANVGFTKLTNRTWLQIVKNPAGHAGEKVIIYGQIYQFDNFTGTDSFMAIAGPTQNESSSDTNTSFTGDAAMLADFVKDDMFRAEAIVIGADDYQTQDGGTTTAPKLQIVSIKSI